MIERQSWMALENLGTAPDENGKVLTPARVIYAEKLVTIRLEKSNERSAFYL